MTDDEKSDYTQLTSVGDRAKWLYARRHSALAELDIDDELALAWRVYICGVAMPLEVTAGADSQEQAVAKVAAWLETKF